MTTVSSHPSVRTKSISIGKLVEEICDRGEVTILIACCSRSHFLEQLIEYTRPDSATAKKPFERPTSRDSTSVDVEDLSPPLQRQSHLVQPTLKLLAASSRVKLAFCSTIPTFRAYLSTLPVHAGTDDAPASKTVIINVLALHRDTSESTVQGLSRSFSLIASVNHSFHGAIEMLECSDDDGMTSAPSAPRPWETEVPLLSGSIKIGEAGQGWATRKVGISSFANRWFNFE